MFHFQPPIYSRLFGYDSKVPHPYSSRSARCRASRGARRVLAAHLAVRRLTGLRRALSAPQPRPSRGRVPGQRPSKEGSEAIPKGLRRTPFCGVAGSLVCTPKPSCLQPLVTFAKRLDPTARSGRCWSNPAWAMRRRRRNRRRAGPSSRPRGRRRPASCGRTIPA